MGSRIFPSAQQKSRDANTWRLRLVVSSLQKVRAKKLAQGTSYLRDVGSLADRLQAATNPKCSQFYYAPWRDTSKPCLSALILCVDRPIGRIGVVRIGRTK